MTAITIYHNPECSKSRQTLYLLREKRADIHIVLYTETPPSEKELKNIVRTLNISATELVRTNENDYKNSGLTKTSSEVEIFSAIKKYPKLMQRPIVISGDHARIGRPPESVLEII
tara:strand:- start:433 stop:780 length:348 start_codon:yes stop_codon:yes gene_type:complete